MKKLMTMLIVLMTIMLLSSCYNQDGTLSFGSKEKVVKPTETKLLEEEIETENLITTEITGENNMTNPIVTFTLDNDMVINVELYPDKAPNTVNNFIDLVKKGYYDGLIFHRIIDGFMVQGGDPDSTGMGGPGYGIEGEFTQNGFAQNDVSHVPGVISMARSASPNSAGSQFFLMVGNSSHLDGAYAAFGKTVDEQSLKNCLDLAKVKVGMNDRPENPPVMTSVTVDTKGIDYEEPKHS